MSQKININAMVNTLNIEFNRLGQLTQDPLTLAKFFRLFYKANLSTFQGNTSSLEVQVIKNFASKIFDMIYSQHREKKLPISPFLKVCVLYLKEDERCQKALPGLLTEFEKELESSLNEKASNSENKCWKKAYKLSQLIQQQEKQGVEMKKFLPKPDFFDGKIRYTEASSIEAVLVNRWELASLSPRSRAMLVSEKWSNKEPVTGPSLKAYEVLKSEALECFKFVAHPPVSRFLSDPPSSLGSLGYKELMELIEHLSHSKGSFLEPFKRKCYKTLSAKINSENVLEILPHYLLRGNADLILQCIRCLNESNGAGLKIWSLSSGKTHDSKLNLSVELGTYNENIENILSSFFIQKQLVESISSLSLSELDWSELLLRLFPSTHLKTLELKCKPRIAKYLLQQDMNRLLQAFPNLEKLYISSELFNRLQECNLQNWKNLKVLVIDGAFPGESFTEIFPNTKLYVFKKDNLKSYWECKNWKDNKWTREALIVEQKSTTPSDKYAIMRNRIDIIIPEQAFEECSGLSEHCDNVLQHYLKEAEKDSLSQSIVGFLYENGRCNAPKDRVKALEYYQKAAAKENSEALFSMGEFHENGFGGLPQDPAKALEYYKKAAAKGNIQAQDKLKQLSQINH